MTAKRTPDAWYWSYDIQAGDLPSVLTPGMRLIRLSAYRNGDKQRYAALVYQDSGPERKWLLDLEASAIEGALAAASARAVSIAVDDAGPAPRFSLVTQVGPGPLSSLHVDLDDAAARALVDDAHGIVDFATYRVGGQRRYAVIREERSGPSWWLAGLTEHQLDRELIAHGAALTRVRSYVDGGVRYFTAVAEKLEGSWAWYADLDADAVGRNLEANASYPVDLDTHRDERGLRFTVVMYRDRLR
jgi:Bacterial tandem repeat domain 1